MPRKPSSGTRGLGKQHTCGKQPTNPARCGCSWRGRYKGHNVVLAQWAKCDVDPYSKGKAEAVLSRMRTAINNDDFDPAGERPAQGTDQTLQAFIDHVWIPRVADDEDDPQTATSLKPMLGVISKSRIGAMSLKRLVTAVEDIEEWLKAEGRSRKWSAKTWNGYHELLHRVCKQAVRWKRMATNPMAQIDRRVSQKPDHFKARHLVEDVEDRLFAVVEQLNRPQHRPNRGKLTQAQADAIRAALAAGQSGVTVAAAFKVSPSVVSAIKHGDIWNPEALTIGTKGTEMRRRLIAAFDGGMRAGEMLQVQLSHVNWRQVTFTRADGTRGHGYEIVLPPRLTKGGKMTGESETIFAGTQRFVQLLEQRRFQLKNNKPSRQFLFGSEDGRQQKDFRRMWRELFTLAGLDWGRDKGLVWHTTRHEFISRVAENTNDPVLTKEVARHRQLATTQGYFHARQDRRYAAAAGLNRG